MSNAPDSVVVREEEEKARKDIDQKIKKIKKNLERYYYFRFGISFSSAIAYIFSDEFILSLLAVPLSLISFIGSLWRLYLNRDEYRLLNNKHLSIQLRIFLNTLIAVGGGASLLIAIAFALSFNLLYVSVVLPFALSVIYGGKFIFKTFQAVLWFTRALVAEPGTQRASECWGRTGKYGFSALYCLGMLAVITLTTFTGVISGGSDKIILTFGVLVLAGLNTFYDPIKEYLREKFWYKKTNPTYEILSSEETNEKKYVSERARILELLNVNENEDKQSCDINIEYPELNSFLNVFTTWHKPGSYAGKFGYEDLGISIKAIQKYCVASNLLFEETGKSFVLLMIDKKISTFNSTTGWWDYFLIEKNNDKLVFLQWFKQWISAEPDERKKIKLVVGKNLYMITNMNNLFDVFEKELAFGVNIFSSNWEGKGEIEALFRLADTYFTILSEQPSTAPLTPVGSSADINQLLMTDVANQPKVVIASQRNETAASNKKQESVSSWARLVRRFGYNREEDTCGETQSLLDRTSPTLSAQ